MAENKIEISFGKYLKENRIRNEITVDRISELTNISTDVIELIEEENHKKLPEEVFVKGFLKLYAKELKLSEDLVLNSYRNHLNAYRESLKADISLIKNDKDFWKRIISIMFIFSTLIFVATQLFVSEDNKPADLKNVKAIKKTSEKKSRVLTVKIKAVEDTWLKIIIDDQPHKEYTLSVGDSITLKAEKSYNMMVGSATSVVITLNGKPVATYGKTGQVLNVVLP